MSIWVSHNDVGHDAWADDTEPQPRGGEVRAYAAGWSNHYPTTDVEAPASVGLAHIAPWCVPGWRDDGVDYPECGPWVRLSVDSDAALTWWTKDGVKPTAAPIHASVVLDEGAARQLADDLLAWLARPKVHPRGERRDGNADSGHLRLPESDEQPSPRVPSHPDGSERLTEAQGGTA
jgi:hypothetical protein